MSLAVVKQRRGVLIAHTVQSHGSVDVRIVTTHNVAGGNIDHVFTLIGQQTSGSVALDGDRGPSGEKDSIL